ncbi:MAG: MFS transporter [Acidimicrobiia bacterium]
MTVPIAPPLPHSHTPGSARAALTYRDFRLVWLGLLASNIGTWMQNVALPAYVQRRTGSAAAVGVLVFAQLGPLLVLSIPGGILANRFPRRPWLITMQGAQLVFSLVLAALVARDAPIAALFGINLLVGIANALNAPAFQASIPLLVDRRDLPGAIALNSASLNGSRVIGPVIAALLGVWGVTVSQLFVINAATYLFVIAALAVVQIPVVADRFGGQGWRQLTVGLRIARQRPILGRLLLSMALFSFFSLPYVGLFPSVAELNFGIDASSPTYKWLYATWGLGACLGALGTGTVFAKVDKRRLITPGFLGFAVSLAAFAVVSSPGPAFPIGFVLGFCYFLTATGMLTVLQEHIEDHERAVIMSLWFMTFGGTVPLGNLVFGPIMDHIGARWIMLGGAVFAVFLARWCNLDTPRWRGSGEQPRGKPFQPGDPAALDEYGIVAGD